MQLKTRDTLFAVPEADVFATRPVARPMSSSTSCIGPAKHAGLGTRLLEMASSFGLHVLSLRVSRHHRLENHGIVQSVSSIQSE